MEFRISDDAAERGDVESFLEAVRRHDGEFPLSEYKELRRGRRNEVIELFVTSAQAGLIGYLQAAWHPAGDDLPGHHGVEMAIAPEWRHDGIAEALLTAAVDRLGPTPATFWAHRAYLADAAETGGWTLTRRLLRMSTPLPAHCPETASSPLPIETFRRGRDDAAWLVANNLAFAGHPENGCLRQEDLDLRMEQGWFSPSGFFLAWDGSDVAGSCWTKVHPDGVGEIYIIGIIPRWSAKGLGRALVCRGLHHLGSELNLTRAILYVEADNTGAIGLYESLGFSIEKEIAAFGRPETV